MRFAVETSGHIHPAADEELPAPELRRRRKRKPRGARAASTGPLEPRPERTRAELLTPLAQSKRAAALQRLMNEPVTVMYLEMCKRSGQTPMVGPDPADARISKRQWEKSFRRFATHIVWGDLERPQPNRNPADGDESEAAAKKRAEAATKALVMRGASQRKVDDAPLR